MNRPPFLRIWGVGPDELVVDNFAGGGGASSGIEAAIGRHVDIAINHDAAAIAMHKANHPNTKHYQEDIWQVDPVEACAGRPVAIAWFSPDCTHHSKAKGGQPRKKEIRALANVVITWAEKVRPRIIMLENVEEFVSWGPLDESGKIIKAFAGEDFRAWMGRLSALGYVVEFKIMVAADYGAPTTRKRLFIIARCDGGPIVWPEPTHGNGRGQTWRPASDIIDWSLPCPSIFSRPKPLKDATLRRIAKGIKKFVIDAKQPFIIATTHHGADRVYSMIEPLRTVTAAHRGEFAVVTPFIAKHYGGPRCTSGAAMNAPLGTVTTVDHHALIAPIITKHFGGPNGHSTPGSDIRSALSTITTKDHHAMTVAFLTKYYGQGTGSDFRLPLPTVTAGAIKFGEVRAFLMKYHGGDRGHDRGQLLLEPMRTIDTSNRFGLVMIRGEAYEIVDIGMRMLQPHELFAAQGFRPDYEIKPLLGGKPISKGAQVALAGNSVCPPVAERMVSANIIPPRIELGAA